MRIDTIPKIETFLSDVLLSSKHIPLGVNVVRLASVQDEEGITAMARSIVVRYTGSTVSVEQKLPIVIVRTLRFEIILSSQSYLTESGHDYALQMCAGSYLSLNNLTPTNAGVQVLTPLHMVSESFDGLTDSSHYVYTQTWELEVQEINSMISIDPCVMRGNCSFLFPQDSISTIVPGDVMYGNLLYQPVLPPVLGADYLPEHCGVDVEGPNLVYRHSTTGNRIFLENYEQYVLTSTDQFDLSGQFLICNIRNKDNGSVIREFYAYNCDGRKLIQVGGAQPNLTSNWLSGLATSKVGNVGNPSESTTPEFLRPNFYQKNGFGYVVVNRATIYIDPTNPDATTTTVRYGVIYPVQVGASLKVDDINYIYVGGTPLGKAWIKEDDFVILDPSTYLPETICEEIPLEGELDGCD